MKKITALVSLLTISVMLFCHSGLAALAASEDISTDEAYPYDEFCELFELDDWSLMLPYLDERFSPEKYDLDRIQTYDDVMALSDEEFLAFYHNKGYWGYFDSFPDYLIYDGFGNDEFTDEEKFENLFYNNHINSKVASWINLLLNSDTTEGWLIDNLAVRVRQRQWEPYDMSLTATDFGFPAEWDIYISSSSQFKPTKLMNTFSCRIYPDNLLDLKDFETFFKFVVGIYVQSKYYSNNVDSNYYFEAPQIPMEGGDPQITLLCGDADSSGELNISDAVKLMCHVTNPTLYPLDDTALLACDLYQHGDGVTNLDVLTIQKYLAGMINAFPESYLEDAS